MSSPALSDQVRLYLGYLLFGLVCLAITLLALPMIVVLQRAPSRRFGRRLVSGAARVYLRLLTLIGLCRFDLTAIDALRAAPAMMIAPNHPSLLDAVMILSRLPGATCIMKPEIVNNVIFGAAARLAGYIRSKPLRTMVQLADVDLRLGSHVLLFPEGTRTVRSPIGALQGTTGLIAKQSRVPVQTVLIETDSGFLGKGWSLHWAPRAPVTYRVRLGRRFDPPSHTASFVRELEQYFESELERAQLPDFPLARAPV